MWSPTAGYARWVALLRTCLKAAGVIDCRGAAVIPGLIDAHVHIGAVEVDFGNQARRKPTSLIALEMARNVFDDSSTSVTRLCATAAGPIGASKWLSRSGPTPGPDLVISSAMLSQTGGHGDMRQRWSSPQPGCCHARLGMVFSDCRRL